MQPRLRTAALAVLGSSLLVATLAGQPAAARTDVEPGPVATPFEPIVGLPATQRNVDLVGKVKLRHPSGELRPGEIADLSHYGDYAYLNGWRSDTTGSCERGGVYVVDISDFANPRQVGFIPSPAGTFPGEGSQVVHLETPSFRGDVLTINNEFCATSGSADTRKGGFTLIDVTNPRAPRTLAEGFGDVTPDGSAEGIKTAPQHDVHSAFTWQAGSRAYTVAVDNFLDENGLADPAGDIDIFDVTNPRAPRLVSESQMRDKWAASAGGNFPSSFIHDMVVKPIGGRQIMLVSYWDHGYVQLDVTDPANPTVINHSDFRNPDPLFSGFSPAEGNAHEAEFSFDNRFVVAADEDFSPFRVKAVKVTSGANAGDYAGSAVGGGATPNVALDKKVNGPTAYGGYGCDASKPIPKRADVTLPPMTRDEEAILVLQRGPANDPANPEAACFPGEKAENAVAAGWDAVLLTNRHTGSAATDEAFCGSGGFPAPPAAPILAVCTTHAALHRIFGSEPAHGLPVPPDDAPALGTVGEKVSAVDDFDGWGYTHLFDRATMRELDVWAPTESRDPRFAQGFGDLTAHEAANDPVTSLAYISHYNAGFRVLSFGAGKLTEVGRFIDDRGNNLWGVDVAEERNGARVVLASDRDYGLYVLRYTGPGAVGPRPKPGSPLRSIALARKAKIRTLLARRLRATIRCTRACKVEVRLRGRLRRRTVTIAKASGTLTRAGSKRITLKKTRSVSSRSLRKRKRISTTARIKTTDPATRATYNSSRKVSLRR